jgi:alpha-ketoglutarate-dependent taurine dioxygenase
VSRYPDTVDVLDTPLRAGSQPGRPAIVDLSSLTTLPDACAWLDRHRAELRAQLDRFGAVYLRGLPIREAGDFGAVRDTLITVRAHYKEKATPRSTVGDDVFSSTDLPAAQPIRPHNENSYTLTFPGILLFCCLVAPDEGGATPVTDCRQVLAGLPPDLVDRFRRAGWALARAYGEHISLDWRTAFGTDQRADVERYCDEHFISYEWQGDALRTMQRRPATIHHPRTGEEVWFNHVAFWNEESLDPDIRAVLVEELGIEGLPFRTMIGDGTALTADEIAQLHAAYQAATVRETWQPGDLMIVDNILAAHGREAFRGDRRIVVAMGEPVAVADCRPSTPPSAQLTPATGVDKPC